MNSIICLLFIFSMCFLHMCESSKDKNHVEFHLFANGDPENCERVNTTHMGEFTFNTTFHYIVLCHGYKSSMEAEWYYPLIDEFVHRAPDYGVIATGYKKAMNGKTPEEAATHVDPVGRTIGAFVAALFEKKGIPMSNIEIVGYGLGAQIAGVAGEYARNQTGSSVKQIFGLDPSTQGFQAVQKRLQSGDANRVVAFHASLVDTPDDTYDIAFFPNGGNVDRYCGEPVELDGKIAIYFLYCSINHKCTNIGTLCDSFEAYEQDQCQDNPTAEMGYELSASATHGDYYLIVPCTSVESPKKHHINVIDNYLKTK